MHKRISYETQFNPFLYLTYEASLPLRSAFAAQHLEIPMKTVVRLQKNHWALRVPLRVFSGDYTQGWSIDALLEHREGRLRYLEGAHRAACAAAGVRLRRTWIPRSDVLEYDDWPYYTVRALAALAEYAPHREFFIAAHAFIKAANNNFDLVRVNTHNVTPYTPPEQRIEKFGSMVRGPAWTADEDAVLRQWFGRRTYGEHAGKHVVLSDEEWGYVLNALGGRRNKQSVRNRICVLNEQLHRSMEVDGFVARDRLEEYMSRVLGEKPRRPRMVSTPPRKRRPVASIGSAP